MPESEWKALLAVWLKHKFGAAVRKWKAPLTSTYEKESIAVFKKFKCPKPEVGTE